MSFPSLGIVIDDQVFYQMTHTDRTRKLERTSDKATQERRGGVFGGVVCGHVHMFFVH